MNALEILQRTAGISDSVLQSYVKDLSDADLLLRPHPKSNHLAWQLGHLIASECLLLDSIRPGAAIALPAGFADQHAVDKAASDNPADFRTKAEYLDLMARVRAATGVAIAQMSEADLDGPSPERYRSMFPTVGDIAVLIATHGLMHAGQFVPVRRSLGKPVAI